MVILLLKKSSNIHNHARLCPSQLRRRIPGEGNKGTSSAPDEALALKGDGLFPTKVVEVDKTRKKRTEAKGRAQRERGGQEKGASTEHQHRILPGARCRGRCDAFNASCDAGDRVDIAARPGVLEKEGKKQEVKGTSASGDVDEGAALSKVWRNTPGFS